ncbi:mevalonate kinase [Marinobacterium iners]|uniref:mevalonate kinase n=1 Tax=Marinobacterium iners TaxID=48076 RepID=UPI001AF84EAE|nr:mevalonate kinase [Marinobacterium iners]QSR34126.1 mevalonate kinase [Marinobacterium iners]
MSAYSKINTRAPGSIMLMGEHAVLFGEPALACALEHWLEVELTPLASQRVEIDSALARYRSDLSQLQPEPALSFVLAVIEAYRPYLKQGFRLQIRSGFSHTVGLGSSAAVTAAVTAALAEFCGTDTTPEALFEVALHAVHQAQNGRGSGTDLAASIYGGVVQYRVSPRTVERLNGLPPLALMYCGYKMKTPEVLALVESRAASQSSLYAGLYRLMGQTCEAGRSAVDSADWSQLGQLMNLYQGLMDALGVNDATLSEMIWRLRAQPGILGAKISGSGLGDCVLALGHMTETLPWESIPVSVAATGVEISHDTC